MDDKQIFIGKNAIITDAPNKSLVDLSGIIIDETKNTLVFKISNMKKTVLKSGVVISSNGKTHRLSQKNIQERIKSR